MALNMFRGTGEAYFAPAVVDMSQGGELLAAELIAALKFGAGFNQIQGLEPQQNQINTPVLRHRTEVQIAGPETFQQVTVTVLEDDGSGVDSDAIERQEVLTTMVADAEGVLILSRYSQAPTIGDPVWCIGVTVASQVPNWDLGATAETTGIVLTPTTPLYKMVMAA